MRTIVSTDVDPIYYFHNFNKQERSVLLLLVKGATEDDLQQHFQCKRRTIQDYMKRIQKKIGARSKEEITAFAKEAGLSHSLPSSY